MKFVQLKKIDREKLKYIVKQYKLIEKCDKMLCDCGVYSRTGFHRDLVTASATQIKKNQKRKTFIDVAANVLERIYLINHKRLFSHLWNQFFYSLYRVQKNHQCKYPHDSWHDIHFSFHLITTNSYLYKLQRKQWKKTSDDLFLWSRLVVAIRKNKKSL